MKCKKMFSIFIYILTQPNYGSGCCLYIFPNSHVVDKLRHQHSSLKGVHARLYYWLLLTVLIAWQ